MVTHRKKWSVMQFCSIFYSILLNCTLFYPTLHDPTILYLTQFYSIVSTKKCSTLLEYDTLFYSVP